MSSRVRPLFTSSAKREWFTVSRLLEKSKYLPSGLQPVGTSLPECQVSDTGLCAMGSCRGKAPAEQATCRQACDAKLAACKELRDVNLFVHLAALPPEFREESGRPVLADETVDTL